MTSDERREVEQRARAFRAALAACDPRQLPLGIEQFPRGACGDASRLLGRYLCEAGLGPVDYVWGTWSRGGGANQTHGWLQRGDLIIDVTADQFAGVREPVIVTTDPSWHARFKGQERYAADPTFADCGDPVELARAYRLVVEQLGRT